MHHHKYRLIIPFVLPSALIYGVFVLWPYAQALYFSLTRWRGFSRNRPFVGLDNFERMLDDRLFWNALEHNALMLVVLPSATVALSLLFSALIAQGGRGLRGAEIYRIVSFFPQVMSAVVIGVLWSFVFHPNIGVLNGFLRVIGLGSLQRTWLGDPQWVLWAIALVAVWSSVGFFMILFIAGMQSIPTDLYDAATVDGASRWRAFFGITLPLLRDHLQVAFVFMGLSALDLFALVQVMAENGGPSRAADVIARYMYDLAFNKSQFGYATAIGVVLLILSLVLSVLVVQLTQRERIEF
ncbi:MAG TPA: sugar ABC transporter permease [Thermomicrobiales bacterium]